MFPLFLNSAMWQRNLRCFLFPKLAFGNKNSVMLKFGQTGVVCSPLLFEILEKKIKQIPGFDSGTNYIKAVGCNNSVFEHQLFGLILSL